MAEDNEGQGQIDPDQSEKKKKILIELRQRFQTCLEEDDEQRRDAMEDMKFANIPGYQWEDNMKQERGERPCYEFNKIRVTGKRIVNNMRANRPSGKVRPVEGGDKDIAEIYEGLIRNIWSRSDADSVVDYESEYQVYAGYGAWRITTGYVSDDMFEQDITIETIPNPFTLFADPASKLQLKQDARFWIITEKIAQETFEEQWPKAEPINFESHEFDDDEDWDSDEEVRIAEYWYKEPHTKTLLQLQDGKVVDGDSDEGAIILKDSPDAIKNQREVETNKIMMCIVSGSAVLEGPHEWAGAMFPFVPLYGDYYVIDGKVYWNGITRFAKDAQRSYNVSRTAITETIAQAPQAKWFVTPKQSEGHTAKWAEAHKKNFPFLLYNPDPQAPGQPQRIGGADIPIALIQESQLAAEEINMVTGIYQADLGSPNQATSGRQEIARQQAGHVATFNYEDNAAKAINRTWELLIDLIPKVYDTERELRILGSDGADDYKRVNSFVQGPEGPVKVNDLTHGKYDVTITVGPNFTTKRQEASETYQTLLQSSPDLMGIIGDLIFKSMDLPYSEDIAERLKVMLPPQIQQLINQNQQIPPEVQAMMAQAQQAMAMVEEQMAAVQEEANNAEIAKNEAEKLLSKLEAKKADFEAYIAKETASLVQMEASLAKEAAGNIIKTVEDERDDITNATREEALSMNQVVASQLVESIASIQQAASNFQTEAVKTMDEIQSKKLERPRIKRVEQKRVNGKLVAEPIYEE